MLIPQSSAFYAAARFDSLFNQCIDFGPAGAVIHDGGANCQLPVDHGRRRRDGSGFLEVNHNSSVDEMRVVAGSITETHDVQLHGRQQFEFGRLLDPALQIAR